MLETAFLPEKAMDPARPPCASGVPLTADEQTRLEALVRAHATPHAWALRCRLLLRSAAPDHPANRQVATALACVRHPVGRWRQR